MGFTVETMVKCPTKLLPEILKKSLQAIPGNGRVTHLGLFSTQIRCFLKVGKRKQSCTTRLILGLTI